MNVTLPDGTVIKNVPDTITKAQLREKLMSSGFDFEAATYAPTAGMSGPERVAAGAGKAVSDVGFGIKQLAGQAKPGELAEKRKRDEALSYTTGGKAGEVLGTAAVAAPVAMLPGANTALGSGLYGAGFGAAMPAESGKERLGNIALSGIGSAAVTGGMNKLGKMSLSAVGRGTPGTTGNQVLDQSLEAGYRVTPTEGGQNWFARALQGFSGSAKLEKNLSGKNAVVTNRLISEELGLPKGQKITLDSLENVRKPAYQAYEDVKGAVKLIKPDAQFRQDLQALRGDFTNAAKDYPELMTNEGVEKLIASLDTKASPRSMVELTRKLRKDASANLKNFADPEKRALGTAQRDASNALEELIDRALTSVGKNDLVTNWRSARQLLAKTYDVESALNETTGNVSTRQLAKMLDKGKPFTGNLEKAAQFGRQFEGSSRDVDKMRDAVPMDFGDVALGTFGNIALLGSRPATKGLLASKAYQSTIKPSRNLPLSDIRNLDNLTRGSLPLTLGGISAYANE